MEAPEKIYLQDSMSTDTIGDLWPEWFDAEVSDNSIEYTRTDVIIKKVENFLYEKLNNGDMECGDIITFINDFINYIKK